MVAYRDYFHRVHMLDLETRMANSALVTCVFIYIDSGLVFFCNSEKYTLLFMFMLNLTLLFSLILLPNVFNKTSIITSAGPLDNSKDRCHFVNTLYYWLEFSLINIVKRKWCNTKLKKHSLSPFSRKVKSFIGL